jgi:hypothetical protein
VKLHGSCHLSKPPSSGHPSHLLKITRGTSSRGFGSRFIFSPDNPHPRATTMAALGARERGIRFMLFGTSCRSSASQLSRGPQEDTSLVCRPWLLQLSASCRCIRKVYLHPGRLLLFQAPGSRVLQVPRRSSCRLMPSPKTEKFHSGKSPMDPCASNVGPAYEKWVFALRLLCAYTSTNSE